MKRKGWASGMLAASCWLTACAPTGEEGLGFGLLLLRTTLLLVLVCGLAVVTLRLAARRGFGRPRGGGRLEVLEELVLSSRESVVAIRALDRVLLVARTPAGMRTLGECDAVAWRGRSFSEVLEQTRGGAAVPDAPAGGAPSDSEMIA